MHRYMQQMAQSARTDRKQPALRYTVDKRRIADAALCDAFVESHKDEETAEWLVGARSGSALKEGCASFLTAFCSRTTANAVTFRGGMFVLSKAQVDGLLGRRFGAGSPSGPASEAQTMIDIGAGDGGVTGQLRRFFGRAYATEASYAMQLRLRLGGYRVQAGLVGEEAAYDLVSCLNVLDRADRPLDLLRDMRLAMKPGGQVLLAVVLPWCPFVEDGPRQKDPSQTAPMLGGTCREGASFEAAVDTLVRNVLLPAGFKVEAWTRVPYLCEGSPSHEYYALDDSVFVLSKADGPLPPAPPLPHAPLS
jgi:SAM-dependent methyltransferase